jgi:hypothetical protein
MSLDELNAFAGKDAHQDCGCKTAKESRRALPRFRKTANKGPIGGY